MSDDTANPARTYPDALRALWARSSYERGYITNPFADPLSADRGLRRTAALLDRLGRPQDRYAIAHVAGSKGKGSTCAMIAAVLKEAGHRVGLATSPHLHSWRERVAIDGEPVPASTFAALTARAVAAAERVEAAEPAVGQITTFELMTAIALDGFATAGCDVAVVEVGLGGAYDATNVLLPVVAAITRLDLEHTAVLGPTLADIAVAKAGIIKPGRPIVVSPQEPAALAVLEATAAERSSPLLLGGRDWHWTGDWRAFAATGPWGRYDDLCLSLPGPHQVENAGTALAALWQLASAGVTVPEQAIRAGLVEARWPGRFELMTVPGGPKIVLDGAHTPAAAAALAATFTAELPGRRAVVVLGTSTDKDAVALGRALAPVASVVVATRSHNPRAASAETVAAGTQSVGLPTEIVGDVATALGRAIDVAGTSGVVLVTGSLFTVAEAREALGLAVADPPPATP